MRLRASSRLHRFRALASALRLTKVVDQGSLRDEIPCSGLAESSSLVEIDCAQVKLPTSTNSGESGGDELSEAERLIRGDDGLHHRTETTSGDERDRATSQALESSGVLTDEVLLQGLSTPRGLSRVVEGSEPPSGGSANGGTRSPQDSVERALRALPDFVGMPGMRFEVSATALDPTAGISIGESFARALRDHPKSGLHEDRARARSRSKSGDGRGRDSTEGTPSKRQKSLSSTPDGVSVRDQIAALMDTPSEANTYIETGTAVRGLMPVGRERSPTRTVMEIDIGTPVREVFEGSPLDDRDERGRLTAEVMRNPERVYEEVRRIMRVVENLKATVDGHERRQKLVDGLYDELDRLGLQIAGLNPNDDTRINAIEERINVCERTKVTEERAADIAHMCVTGSRVAQDEFENEKSERVRKVAGDIELLAEKINAIRRECKVEIGERIKDVTADLSTRIIKGASSEAASRARQVGELGESVKVIASRVDGIQDTAARCKSDCSKMHQMFSDLHRRIGDKISCEDGEAESRRVASSLQDIREQLQGLVERLGACERDSLAVVQGWSRNSGNPGSGPSTTIDAEARGRITKECGNITRVVRLLAARMNEKDDLAMKEIGRVSAGVEKMRDALTKLAENVTKTRDEALSIALS